MSRRRHRPAPADSPNLLRPVIDGIGLVRVIGIATPARISPPTPGPPSAARADVRPSPQPSQLAGWSRTVCDSPTGHPRHTTAGRDHNRAWSAHDP